VTTGTNVGSKGSGFTEPVGPRAVSGARWWRAIGVAVVTSGLLLAAGCSGDSNAGPAATMSVSCPANDAARRAVGARVSAALAKQFELVNSYSLRELRAVLVDVCGVPVHEEYRSSTADEPHNVASVTKSFIGTLVGTALAEGSLGSLDQTVADLLPEHRTVMSPATASITLRQLLTMTAGLDADLPDGSTGAWISGEHFVEDILRQGIVGTPGTFAYSSASSHLLAAILARATRRSVLDYATEKLFDPLGIDTTGAAQPVLVEASAPAYDKAAFAWPVDPQGINFGAGWLKLRPRDLAKLGQLYLDHGIWQGKHIVPASWVRDATSAQVAAPDGFGGEHYGYQWWVTTAGDRPAYAAIGFGGQLIEVVPDKALVAVFATYLDTLGITPPGPSADLYEVLVSRVIVPALR
jgi:CubicO group peptidase (beta-lactamase class C family)